MQPKIYKINDNYLETNASERQLTAIVSSLQYTTDDNYSIEDVINELDKRGYLAEEIYINTNITG